LKHELGLPTPSEVLEAPALILPWISLPPGLLSCTKSAILLSRVVPRPNADCPPSERRESRSNAPLGRDFFFSEHQQCDTVSPISNMPCPALKVPSPLGWLAEALVESLQPGLHFALPKLWRAISFHSLAEARWIPSGLLVLEHPKPSTAFEVARSALPNVPGLR
jgi:hypothetical protein